MKFKSFFGKFLSLSFVAVAVATLAYATQGIVKSSTYYTSALTTSSNVQRVAPVGNLTIDIVTTSASGVPSVTPTIQGVDIAGNVFTVCAGAAIATAGTATVSVGPALTVATGKCSAPVPDVWNVKMVNASGVGTDGITSTIYYNTAP